MAKSLDDIVRKIKGLQARSKSQNAEEAATCAALAAKLMQEYQISEAILISRGEKAEEKPIRDNVIYEGKRLSEWRFNIAIACCHSLDTYPYFDRGDYKCIGRVSDANSARYIFQMICNQVEDFAKKAYNKLQMTHITNIFDDNVDITIVDEKGWKKNFRDGCASRIVERLKEQKKKEDSRRILHSHGEEAGALIVLNKNALEIKKLVNVMGFTRMHISGPRVDTHGFSAGREAGNKVNIGIKGKAALGSGQKRIKG